MQKKKQDKPDTKTKVDARETEKLTDAELREILGGAGRFEFNGLVVNQAMN